MLTEDLKFCERLRGVIQKLTSDVHLREDLFQMAMIHLLHTESKEPHHTRSWFLNSCKLHLLDEFKKGRSVKTKTGQKTG